MHADTSVNPWEAGTTAFARGGRVVVPREHAPLACALPYRRAAGEQPGPKGTVEELRRTGWSAVLGDRSLGDTLLALGLSQALIDGLGEDRELHYQGPLSRLMQRCQLPLATSDGTGQNMIRAGEGGRTPFVATPEDPPAWLDVLDAERVEIHAALPMRYYLTIEQALGVRLPAGSAPLPRFTAQEQRRPFHVVFITATSWPARKDYGADRFATVARLLTERRDAPWAFTMVTGAGPPPVPVPHVDILARPDVVDCLDVFASADMVIGNDTGLTHLAALTERPNQSGPQVIGLYGRHAHSKWTTGSDRHHAIATPFSQMLSAADRCPVRDHLDDSIWTGSENSLAQLHEDLIVEAARYLAGWW